MAIVAWAWLGETLSAANDAELLDCVHRHMAAEHPDFVAGHTDTHFFDRHAPAGGKGRSLRRDREWCHVEEADIANAALGNDAEGVLSQLNVFSVRPKWP